MMVDVDSSRPGFRPVNASAPCFSRTREGPRQHRVLVRRGGAPRCHFSFSVFRRRLQLWGRPRRQPDRAHAGISAAPTLSAISRARARRRRVVAGRRRSHGDAADRQRDRANGGLCLRRVHSLDFQAGFSGGRRNSLSLGEEPPHAAVGGAAIFFFAYSAGAAGAGRGAISCRVAGAIGGPIGPR